MIGASASLAADDVSIRCRVRRSPHAANPSFGDEQEMTCTMRNWEPTNNSIMSLATPKGRRGSWLDVAGLDPLGTPINLSRSVSSKAVSHLSKTGWNGSTTKLLTRGDADIHHKGPELLLCPVHLPQSNVSLTGSPQFNNDPPMGGVLGQRFHSFGSTPSVTPGTHVRPVFTRQHSRSNSCVGKVETSPGTDEQNRRASDPFPGGMSEKRTPILNMRKRGLIPPMMKSGAAAAFAVGGRSSNTDSSSGKEQECSKSSSLDDIAFLKTYAIPISDIMVVDVEATQASINSPRKSLGKSSRIEPRDNGKMNITTVSNGYFEFSFHSKNAHDVLLAFLQASLPNQRITFGVSAAQHPDLLINPNIRNSWSGTTESFDMDNFTAREMTQRVKKESFRERVRSHFSLIASRLSEMSSTITDCMCGCDNSKTHSALPKATIVIVNPPQERTGTFSTTHENDPDPLFRSGGTNDNGNIEGKSHIKKYFSFEERSPRSSHADQVDLHDSASASVDRSTEERQMKTTMLARRISTSDNNFEQHDAITPKAGTCNNKRLHVNSTETGFASFPTIRV